MAEAPALTRSELGRTGAPTEPTAIPAATRLVSLDAFRGFTMFWLLGGRGLVVALGNLLPAPVAALVGAELSHSEWQGLRFYDLIWPAFMLMAGMSIPFSLANRRTGQDRTRILLDASKRALILFLLGSLRTSIHENQPLLVELSSALQPIGLAYLVAVILSFFSVRVQAAAAALILLGYALLLAFVPAPGMAAASYEKDGNLVAAVDLMVLGRTHEAGWGTVLSAIPTISTTIFGMILGQVLRSPRTQSQKLTILAASGAGAIAAGLLMSPVVPVVMKLWTASYGLLSAGWACLGFLSFYWIVDVCGYRKWSFPFVVIGMNAVAAYMGSTLVPIGRFAGIFTKGIASQWGAFGLVLAAAVPLVARWLILLWMYRRKIFIKA